LLPRRKTRATLILRKWGISMANLTIVIESDTLKRARIRALEEGTSVNAVVRDYLADYAGMKAQKDEAINNLLRLSQRTKTKRGNRRWVREDLHQR
jgi:hypothetical protein